MNGENAEQIAVARGMAILCIMRISRSVTMPTTNTFSVETPRGVRSFHLHQGDICDSRDDVLVASTHAHPGIPLTGAVLDALESSRGCDFSKLEPLLVPRGCFGTYQLREDPPKSQTILVVRIPALASIEATGGEPLAVFKEALWTLFGSLAALELRRVEFRSISLPVLAAKRGYPIRELLAALLDSTLRWLRRSQSTEEISLYVLEPEYFIEWSEELDRLLGRRYFESAKDSVLYALRQELLSLVKESRGKESSQPSVATWLNELAESLADQKLPFHTVAVAGRKLAEFAVSYFLNSLGLSCKGDLYNRIKTIRDTKKVAPWVMNYLMSLKDFGNEKAHIGTEAAYRPPTVSHDDLLALLCSISRTIKIWLEWDAGKNAGDRDAGAATH